MVSDVVPVILSGGSGTRLWPLSRKLFPKQLLPLTGDKTLLQETVCRLNGLTLSSPIIVCNEEHRFLVAEQLREIQKESASIILESESRNTAPALTLAALALSKDESDPVMLVMPADHVIKDIGVFHAAITSAKVLAEKDYLVTFGITPDKPETGYGYIRKGNPVELDIPGEGIFQTASFVLESFVEKPDLATAECYLSSGNYLWNSGMFMMKTSVWLAALKYCRPDIFDCSQDSYEKGEIDWGFYRVDANVFSQCPNESIDYAVMEQISQEEAISSFRSAVIPLTAGWSDIGAWSTLWENQPRDNQNNVISGDVIAENTTSSFLYATDRLLAVVGVDDMVIVETADAVLVARKDSAQDVKKIVDSITQRGRKEHIVHRRVHRPWGNYEEIDVGERYQVKRITVNPGAELSLQMHHHRAEHWIVVKGTARVIRGDEEILLTENKSTYIPLGTIHRLGNPGTIPLEMIEVQSGSYLGEDDIVRFEDSYGRDS